MKEYDKKIERAIRGATTLERYYSVNYRGYMNIVFRIVIGVSNGHPY